MCLRTEESKLVARRLPCWKRIRFKVAGKAFSRTGDVELVAVEKLDLSGSFAALDRPQPLSVFDQNRRLEIDVVVDREIENTAANGVEPRFTDFPESRLD